MLLRYFVFFCSLLLAAGQQQKNPKIVCPAGKYKKPHAAVCEECAVGQYQDKAEQFHCLLCDGAQQQGYQDQTGQTGCKSYTPCLAGIWSDKWKQNGH